MSATANEPGGPGAGRQSVEQLVATLGLEPLPVEGGFFKEIWHSHRHWPGNDKPAGTAIVFLLTGADDGFSAMHRLPTDEIWHRYLGDPAELLLLHPDGTGERVRLGADLAAGEQVVVVVPAGTWMGAHVPGDRPGRHALLGCTLAPGFTPDDYEGGDRAELCARYPAEADLIERLTRPDGPRHMPAPPHTGVAQP
jgi:predicted cupin superfamily sugar epimerase